MLLELALSVTVQGLEIRNMRDLRSCTKIRCVSKLDEHPLAILAFQVYPGPLLKGGRD